MIGEIFKYGVVRLWYKHVAKLHETDGPLSSASISFELIGRSKRRIAGNQFSHMLVLQTNQISTNSSTKAHKYGLLF